MTTTTVALTNPAQSLFAWHISANARRCQRVVERDSAKEQTLVIAGAGPTLEQTAGVQADQVWACNRALNWMLDHGHRVTHGFTTNNFAVIADVWKHAPDVEYLLASTTHCELAARLVGRRITWFHNLVNLEHQERMYATLYPETVMAGAGLNVVTRALDVAEYMGFRKITVIGADCAMQGDVVHVGGGTPDWDYQTLEAEIDGRRWSSTADMWVSANWLTRMARTPHLNIELMGDTLPVALLDKPVEFLDRLPHTTDEDGNRLPIPYP